MTPETGSMEQAISRAIRANLDGLQRQSSELQQAIADLVAACSSSRPANALAPTLRAQAAAASLAASLEVLGRFIATAGQSSRGVAAEEQILRTVELPVQEAPAESTPSEPASPADSTSLSSPVAEEADLSAATYDSAEAPPETVEAAPAMESAAGDSVDSAPLQEQEYVPEPPLEQLSEPQPEPASSDAGAFDLHALSAEEQEMHRRANRVAKVSMQDIQLLKPEAVRLGREHRDLCIRLNDEIGKARKEYERRFGPILGHGVDYFYHWMVEVLGAGDPEALGVYPYSSSPALRQ